MDGGVASEAAQRERAYVAAGKNRSWSGRWWHLHCGQRHVALPPVIDACKLATILSNAATSFTTLLHPMHPSIQPPQNTTPDDVHICEAYLAFLRSNGNNSEYWRVLTGALRLLSMLGCVCCIAPAALLHFARPGALRAAACAGAKVCGSKQRQKSNTEVDLLLPLLQAEAGVTADAVCFVFCKLLFWQACSSHYHLFCFSFAAEAGVTRQMLESLDRAIRCEPEW